MKRRDGKIWKLVREEIERQHEEVKWERERVRY